MGWEGVRLGLGLRRLVMAGSSDRETVLCGKAELAIHMKGRR